MTTNSSGEAYGSKGLTWAIIAVTALLLVEVTWPQAMPAVPADAASVATTSAPVERVARAN